MTKSKAKKSGPSVEVRQKAYTTLTGRTRNNKNAIVAILKLSDQPLVTTEVIAHLKLRGVSLHETYVSKLLKELVAAGEISQREETSAEREIRFGRVEPRGAHFTAMYFWAPAGVVPKRTQTGNLHMASRMTQGAKKHRPAKKTARVQTGRKIATRENIGLLARVAELEKQVEEMRSLLGTK